MPFGSGKTKATTYESDIVLGQEYRDKQTGIEGVATVVSFYQHACERVILEWHKDGDVKEWPFEAERLEKVSPAAAEPPRPTTGGPGRAVPRPAARA